MTQFVSTKGGVTPVDFETAVLQGFAADGGGRPRRMVGRVARRDGADGPGARGGPG